MPKPDGTNASIREMQEEASYLRQKCNSLSMRGHYVECVKTIEEHLSLFYQGERWPEQFFTILRLHQKCYPSTNRDQSHEEYMAGLLKKNNIPMVFAGMLRKRDSELDWSSEHFRDCAVNSENNNDLPAALAYSDLLLKVEPSSANAYLLRGRILSKMDRDKEALEMMQIAMEMNPSNRHVAHTLARHYLKATPAKALETVEQAIEAAPDDAVNYALKAEVLDVMQDEEGALAALEEATRLDPYNADYPYQRAEMLYKRGKEVAALPQYRRAIALNERHVPSLMRLCELSFEKQPDLALSYITTVVAAQPENTVACLRKAQLLQKTGALEAAMRQYRALLELDAQNHAAYGGLGALYLRQGAYDLALQQLSEAVRLAPQDIAYRMDKAKAHRLLEQAGDAASEYKTVLSMDKNHAAAYGELGFLSADRPKEALDYFQKALAIDGKNAFYHAARAEILLDMPGKREEAVRGFELACKYDPGNGELHAKFGRILEHDGNLASAMQHYIVALGLVPDDADTHYHLGRLYESNRPSFAYLHLRKAITLSVTRGEYYFAMSRTILALRDDPVAAAQLCDLAVEAGETEALPEISDIRSDNALRIALVYIDRAIELDSENPQFLGMRAHLFYYLGQMAKALDQYKKLLAVNANEPEALFGMARILADKQGEEKQALDYLNRAIAVAPAVAEYHAAKAALLARDEANYEQAVAAYAEAIQRDTNAWQVILEKARLLDGHGDISGALTEYRRVLLVRRDCSEASLRTGILVADSHPSIAQVYLDHAVKLRENDPVAHIWRGRVLYAQENAEEAEEEFITAISVGGDNEATRFALASALAPIWNQRAEEECRRAMEHNNAVAAYHLLLGDLLLEQHDLGQANACYNRAIELDSSLHIAYEKRTGVAILQGAPEAGELLDSALGSNPDCPACLFLKAQYLERIMGDLSNAAAYAASAAKRAPEELAYQEKLVELLSAKKSLLKLVLEKRKLERLRQRLNQPLEAPEPPPFDEDDIPEGQSLFVAAPNEPSKEEASGLDPA